MAKKQLESLIKAGALDSLGINRGRLFATVESEIERTKVFLKSKEKGQWSFFGDTLNDDIENIDPPSFYLGKDWTQEEYQTGENEVLEYYFSGHPLDSISNKYNLCLSSKNKDKDLTVIGIIRNSAIKPIKTGQNKGKKMLKGIIEDRKFRMPFIVFSDTYDTYQQLLENNQIVVMTGFISDKLGDKELIVREVYLIDNFIKEKINSIILRITSPEANFQKIAQILENHPGIKEVYFYIEFDSYELLGYSDYKITLNDHLINDLCLELGSENIKKYL